jgi:hypothetical protein
LVVEKRIGLDGQRFPAGWNWIQENVDFDLVDTSIKRSQRQITMAKKEKDGHQREHRDEFPR